MPSGRQASTLVVRHTVPVLHAEHITYKVLPPAAQVSPRGCSAAHCT